VSALSRFLFAFAAFFRIVFDGAFAKRVQDAEQTPALPPGPEPGSPSADETREADQAAALQLLGLLQREGRLVDFLQQDIDAFSDAEVGAAARAVHAGCRKALHAHAQIAPVMTEPEGARVTVDGPVDPSRVKLTGNVAGSAPYHGTLRHRGWKTETFELPERVDGHDFSVLAPAEVEL
jgi:hypothetical protein